MPLTLIFDFGGVIFDWNPRYLYRKLFASEPEMEGFLREVGFNEWNTLQDAGRPFSAGVAELTARFPAYREQIAAYPARFPESVGGLIPGSVALLQDLARAGHPLHALSNWSAETFSQIRAHYPFLDLFTTIVLSGEVGVNKPDRRAYEALLARVGQPAAACVFIDDSAHNVAAAAALGFQTILFRSSAALRAELAALGVRV